jgi:lipopolysaccharide assembly protein A
MRLLCFLFLVAFVGAVVAFALQNQQEITLSFFKWNMTLSVAIVAGGAFLLGMLSGWSVVGMLRRSLRRVTDSERQYAAR